MAFDLLVPEDEESLFSLMEKADYRFLAGGTDLFVKMEKNQISPDRVIDLTKVMSGQKVEDRDETISIPATTTFQKIAESPLINKEFPVLAQSARAVGATQLRNMATIGGNICNASPSADSLIALYLLNCELTLVSREGERRIPIREFITGPGQTDLSRGEYLKSLEITKVPEDFVQYFEKVGRRNALDIAVCTMGYLVKEEDGRVEELRLAYGAVAPTVIRATSVEDYLQGKKFDRETIAEAKNLVRSEISPISDIRGSAEYREKVAVRLVEKIADQQKSCL